MLALILGALGSLALGWAATQPGLSAVPGLDASVGVVGVGAALVLLVIGRRLPVWWGIHLGLLIYVALFTVMACTRSTPPGEVTIGFAMIMACLYAAYFLPTIHSAAFLVLVPGIYALAATINPVQSSVFYPAVVILVSLLVGGVVASLASDQRRLLRSLDEQATLDPLTYALNRRGIERFAEGERSLAERAGEPTTICLLDLDGFKGFNDRHGHHAGDALLRDVVASWRSALRAGDLLARVGGDEFLIVLPGTSLEQSSEVISRLRAAHPATWSVGTARWVAGPTVWEVADVADGRLYEQKATRHEQPRASGGVPRPSDRDRHQGASARRGC